MARLGVAALAVMACGHVGFDPRAASDGSLPTPDSAAAPALIAHTMVNVQAAGLTTPAIDTTGATLIVLAECTWSTGTPTDPTDSQNNAWQTGLASYGADSDPANIKMFYAYAPATSSAHTFTDVGNDYLSIGVLAFSGTATLASTAAVGATGATGTDPIDVGAIAPGHAGELVVTFACSGNSVATAIDVDSSFQRVDLVLNGNSGDPEDMASAYGFPSSPVDPSWTFTGDSSVCATGAAFP